MAFGGGFGSNAFGASSSAFANPSQPLFGQSSTPFVQSTSSFGAFGQSTAPFGQSAPAFGQSTPAFGQPAPVFSQSAPVFGQSSPAFGQSASSFGAFGSSQPSLWGQSSSAFASSQPFGSSQPFASSQPALGAQSQSLFASSQPAFSQSQPFVGQSQLGTGWSNQNQQSTGHSQPPSTRSVQYQVSSLFDNNSTEPSKFHAITAMNQFQSYSMEELRVADYARGDMSGGSATGFGAGFANTGTTGFGAQSGGAFGSSVFGSQSHSGFGAQSQPAFGAQSQSLFGGQSQSSLFGSSGAFGSSSGGLFGSNPTQGQSGGLFSGGGGTGGGGTGAFGNTGFGQSSAAASGFGGFGSLGQSQSLFSGGNQQSGGGVFGGQPQTQGGLFGSQPQSGSGLFGSQPQSGLFGSQQQSSGGLFGNQQSGGGLFGARSQTGGGLFGASSSALGGSTGFGAPFGGQQAAQSAPSLFGASGAAFGGGNTGSTGGLFGGQTGSGLFGNTRGGLFGSGASFGGFGSSSASLFGTGSGPSLFGTQPGLAASSNLLFGSGFGSGFGTGFGSSSASYFQQQQQQQRQQGSLEASVTRDPYGQSQLFSFATNQLTGPSSDLSTPAASLSGQPHSKEVRVVVKAKAEPSRRVRGSQTIARQSALFRTSGNDWYNTSPIRHWGPQRSLFAVGTSNARDESSRKNRSSHVGWRSEEQKKKAANIRKLVIQPMEGDPILKAASGQNSGLLRGRGLIHRPTSEGRIATTVGVREKTNIQAEQPESENGRPKSLPARPNKSQEYDRLEARDEVEPDAETSIGSDPAEEKGAENVKDHDNEDEEHSELRQPGQDSAEVENFNSRFVPYKDYYKTQMRRSRRQSLESEMDVRPHRLVAPVSSTPNLRTSPSLSALKKMNAEELSNVQSFKVWKPDIGEIEWLEPVDLRGIDLDQTVRIEPKEVCVYAHEEDVPARGEGLNRPAIIRLHGIWKMNKETGRPLVDASTVAAIVRKLKAHCEEERVEFVGYQVGTGTWTFKAESF